MTPESTAPVTVRVYDREQAEALKAYLDEAYGFTCEIAKIDLGITKPTTKRQASGVKTAEERRAAKALANRRHYLKTKGVAA